jgi:hypothetical protein
MKKRDIFIEKPMWLAIDAKGNVQATWYKGCVQPWRKWCEAVKHFGWRTRHASVVFKL